MKQILLFFTLFSLINSSKAQDVAIGQWKEHLAYKNAISVAEGNGKVYCATKSGIFILNKSDNSMDRLSKVNGLSDVEASVLNYNPFNKTVLIAYKNANIDLIIDNSIINISDIKRKSILGNKSINTIFFVNQYAYLACGFGIVVIDTDKKEVKDTYYIGPNGNSLNVREVTSDNLYLYAATDDGVYRALLSNSNLANFSSWAKMSGLPKGIYNTITSFNGKVYTNFSKALMKGAYNEDTMYVYDQATWKYFSQPFGYIINSLKSFGDKLIKVENWRFSLYDVDFNKVNEVASYFNTNPVCKQVVVDNKNTFWAADEYHSLVSCKSSLNYQSFSPNGPSNRNVFAMCIQKNNLWVAPGGIQSTWAGSGNNFGCYSFIDGEWKNIQGDYSPVVNFSNVFDFLNVLADPLDPKRVYLSAAKGGVVEFYDGVPVKQYSINNSTLQYPGFVRGLAMDEYQNLWMTNASTPLPVSIKNKNGVWKALDFKNFISTSQFLGSILIDKNNQKWMIIKDEGLMVYKGSQLDAPNSSNTKKLTTSKGNGGLPSLGVFCLTEDLDGKIWVGTDKGITVFYSPENVFNGQDFDAQQIKIEQDGQVQLLLETELIKDIKIDGANRKWIATANSGVFLMSADGTKQIAHFDETNSPLFSNDVSSIAINNNTGEIYFGTSKGILSYRGTATEGLEDFTDVYAYPNPVKPNYDGPIAIKGLVENTIMKITDVSGMLVYETKSEGGQAIWYGKNFQGQRVSSGVYLVYCASEDGTKKMVTKILFIN
jgi:hypothetical protein